ncbi:MAG: hypothetical protein WD468_08525 [Pirellulales bacterium]
MFRPLFRLGAQRRVPATTRATICAAAALVLSLGIASAPAVGADEKPGAGLADPGSLTALALDFARVKDGAFELSGRDSQQQLVVTGKFSSGQLRDVTRAVAYKAEPANIVKISPTGLVEPLADGSATISIAHPAGQNLSVAVQVKHIASDVPVNFPNQIVPIFTKLGCNSGGCHGKASGQNGFRLSLLGFEPSEDYEHLVKEARGRRLFPAAPDRSLLLLKATSLVPHGGGQRIKPDSYNTASCAAGSSRACPTASPKTRKSRGSRFRPPSARCRAAPSSRSPPPPGIPTVRART